MAAANLLLHSYCALGREAMGVCQVASGSALVDPNTAHTTQSSTNWFWVGPIDHRF